MRPRRARSKPRVRRSDPPPPNLRDLLIGLALWLLLFGAVAAILIGPDPPARPHPCRPPTAIPAQKHVSR